MPKVGKVLVVRFSSMGDVILTTPVVRLLKTQTDCEVHFITKKQFAHLIEENPYVDKLYVIKKDVREVIDDLKREKYNYVIDLHKSLRSLELSFLLGKSASRVDKLNVRKWIFVNTKLNFLPSIHMVDRYVKTIEKFGIINDGKGLDYVIKADKVADQYEKFIEDKTEPILSLVLGAAHFNKVMPIGLKSRICQLWRGKVVLIGGPDEESDGIKLQAMFPEKVMNTAGALSIDESVYMLSKSDVVIAGDTGMMHISAAIQKPLVLVWGSTHKAFGMTPYYGEKSETKYLESKVEGLKCNPCTKMGLPQCPEKHFNCMQLQKPEEIVAKAYTLLS